ncbi:potassium-transporting ATPase subunit C [Tuwongella immobilis]|uniref:Potassium-transporting ATPase KdpC subunit n=1 Tax=Tuwongella immobilis TaxID=692036 RepID=A0A6C2YTP7_9BACT|nr:potassium-transporting ATPase subunit C [Tuwongella immobilis]VIP04262.1 atpase : Potassium-transporting ATPase C chain OS=uncultured Desulfobacterium sp. GN=kdpC PE=3 SV=1: KdpC [Tuwongella immobilis]VTS05887.1 atpase : Potassium-transporting ATPase C chain OS=uncultured Desulfobacterium sp. GN=kdpC PE=3 SV=1: KdpC [Tuwongella immobilis]
MWKHLRANLFLILATLLIGSVAYPLTLLAVGQSLVPHAANGSLLRRDDGTAYGSELVGQAFHGGEWLHPRPSAAGYDASASAGSNWGASNPKLRERALEILAARKEAGLVAADAVTASGSGLDPHISLRNAQGQLPRIAQAWGSKLNQDAATLMPILDGILTQASFVPLSPIGIGEPIVSVLDVNRRLQVRFAAER